MKTATIFAATLALALGACAGQETTRSGFLRDYSGMAADPTGALVYRAPTAPGRYDAFMVDEVAFMPGAKSERVDAAEIAALRQHFKAAVEKAFAQGFRLAGRPGPGVMRVRLAITGVDRADATLNYIATPLVGPVSNGGASSESDVADSQSGKRLAALSLHTNANPFKGGLFEYYTQLGHAKSALELHAAELYRQVAGGK